MLRVRSLSYRLAEMGDMAFSSASRTMLSLHVSGRGQKQPHWVPDAGYRAPGRRQSTATRALQTKCPMLVPGLPEQNQLM